MEIASQDTKVSLGKRTTTAKLEFPPGSTLRLAAILLALGFLLLWGGATHPASGSTSALRQFPRHAMNAQTPAAFPSNQLGLLGSSRRCLAACVSLPDAPASAPDAVCSSELLYLGSLTYP